MKIIVYRIWQSTWGILQTLLGLIMFIIHIRSRHFNYHGAIITVWDAKSSMSLGGLLGAKKRKEKQINLVLD